MAEKKTDNLEREYVIPLRRETLKVPRYERSRRAIRAIKMFLAKHMHVVDRDLDLVKLDVDFNNEVWFRGRAKPPSKVHVHAKKTDGVVRVDFVNVPDVVKFTRKRVEKRSKPAKAAKKPVEKKDDNSSAGGKDNGKLTEGEVKEEKEKAASSAVVNEKQFESEAKAHAHEAKSGVAPQIQRKALKK